MSMPLKKNKEGKKDIPQKEDVGNLAVERISSEKILGNLERKKLRVMIGSWEK